jgi:AbrB family looped-hinge helix DNA binding protein
MKHSAQSPKEHYHRNVPPWLSPDQKSLAQGQISVPAEVRKKLGVGPGSVLEWEEHDARVVVRRAARYTSAGGAWVSHRVLAETAWVLDAV